MPIIVLPQVAGPEACLSLASAFTLSEACWAWKPQILKLTSSISLTSLGGAGTWPPAPRHLIGGNLQGQEPRGTDALGGRRACPWVSHIPWSWVVIRSWRPGAARYSHLSITWRCPGRKEEGAETLGDEAARGGDELIPMGSSFQGSLLPT